MPDKTLEVSDKATQQQIRDAYKKQALKHHPDRVAADSPERAARTKRFQQINDAYYTLSDPTRRRDYDTARSYHAFGTAPDPATPDFDEDVPRDGNANANFGGFFASGFPWSAFGFGSAPGGTTEESHNHFSNAQFGTAFEEMLREQGMAEGADAAPTGKFWAMLGGASGAAMGFIVANFPGMVAGAVAGNRLGAVRDARGKSVYSVFQELPQADKARLLSDLAAKVFAHAVGS
ncbi:DnaJ-domain-containing protein [Bimuria novae-zelandiae CBS 107.79]|uniref:DnaJ-domain-containing protein n=1 Tax=Bimuria novae-zelandiae CBS 107.79 TaxID=1447943 RepID=A0A6A5V3A4_9PLEO|nr:DnaJ-domain-containing protein [Bimuria novae-zelandiae CBS 107.79]